MQKQDFTQTLLVGKSPKEVFDTVVDVRKWWSGLYSEEIQGSSSSINDEFTFRAGGGLHFTTQKLIELVPNKKVTWLVTHSDLTFLEKADEWNGTKITFEISREGDKTQVRFIHQGLVPQLECFDSCSSAWSKYLDEKLRPLLIA